MHSINTKQSERKPSFLAKKRVSIRSLLYSFLGVVIIFAFQDNAMAQVPDHERDALEAFYQETNGDEWDQNDGWMEDGVPVEDWYGISVSDNHVTRIELDENNLSGNLPVEIHVLDSLSRFDIEDNNVGGELHPEYGNWENLTRFNIRDNNIGGTFPPEYGNWVNLSRFSVRQNNVGEGEALPPEYGNWVNLTRFNIRDASISGGIPSEYENWENLERFLIRSVSGLEAVVHEDWAWMPEAWPNLERIYMRGASSVTGELPSEWGNGGNWPETLERLRIGDTALEGTIPMSFTNLEALGSFRFSGTQLLEIDHPAFMEWLEAIDDLDRTGESGPPQVDGQLLESDSLALVNFYNKLDGDNWGNNEGWLEAPPEEWHGITLGLNQVERIELTDNNLSGEFPVEELEGLFNLHAINLSNNELSGVIPADGMINFISDDFRFLNLSGNNFSGEIPGELGTLRLEELLLHDNELEGDIPDELFIPVLERFSLGQNELEPGPIPDWIEDIRFLEELHLGESNRTGVIPRWIGSLDNLSYLDLSGNPDLQGEIPEEVGNLTRVTHFLVDGCNLQGELPAELGDMISLEHLILSDNNFIGELPEELSNLGFFLKRLHVDGNEYLTGTIPMAFTDMQELEEFFFDGTELYEQDDEEFQAWLDGIDEVRSTGLITDAEDDLSDEIPAEFRVEQNYPNPFNPSTTIRYQLPENAHVTIEVFDITGQLVTTLVDETREAGRYDVTFDASGLSSGLYIYRLESGSFSQTRRMMFVK